MPMAMNARHVPVSNALSALAYVLLIGANVHLLTAHDTWSWAIVPTWLLMTGYAASLLKNLAADQRAKTLERVAWLTRIVFFSTALLWPLPLQWYDIFLLVSLLVTPGHMRGSVAMVMYYLFSSAAYLAKEDVLQVCGRGLLLAITLEEALGLGAVHV